MKKLKKLLCLLLAFTIAVSAMSCGRKQTDNDVQTEQNDILTEKSPKPDAENELVEKEPAKEGTFVEEDGTVRQVNTFESEDGWVTFVVNAVVEGYDITELPVVSVVPNHYDSTELKQISEAFAQENTVYGYTEQLTVTELNHVRDEFEDLIEAYKNRTADGAINATDEELADSIAGWQAYIDAIDADLVNAPEEMPYTEPVYEYGPESRYDEGKSYLRGYYGGKNTFLAYYTDDGRIMKITASDVTRNEKASSFGLEGDEIYPYNYNVIFAAVDNKRNGSFGGTYTQKTPFTEEEKQKATEEVLAVVQNTGMGDWKLVAVAEGNPVKVKSILDILSFLHFHIKFKIGLLTLTIITMKNSDFGCNLNLQMN